MLRAFEERLQRLMDDKENDFHDRIRRRVGKRATPLLEQRLKNLIALMPRLLSRVLKQSDRKEIPTALKKSVGFALTYFYHPKDFLPEDNGELFGYLDDALCIALIYEKVLRVLQKGGVPLSAEDAAFMREFSLMKRSVKAVIPEEAQKVSGMVAGILKGDHSSFDAIFS